MVKRSRRRTKVHGPSVKPPPRATNWIFTGSGRGYQFVNLDSVRDARAEMSVAGVSLKLSNSYEALSLLNRPAEDVIAHLVMVGIDVTGAAEVLRERLGQNLRETLQALYVLEDDQLEPFHSGEIGIESEEAAGDAGGFEEFCVICGCTESTPCTGNDGNPCHWTRPGVMCSTCAEALEVLEKYDEIGDLAGMKLTPAESRVLEILEKYGYEPGAAANLRRTHGLVDKFHDPATPCAHDEKEECDDCNDCGGPVLETPPPLDGDEKPGCVWWNSKGTRFELGDDLAWHEKPAPILLGNEARPRVGRYSLRMRTPEPSPDPEVDAMIGRIRNSIGKPTNCLDCLKVDQPSCTWSNGGPAPCPGFERDAAAQNDSDRVFMKRSADDPAFMLRGPRGTSVGRDPAAAADGFDLLDEQTAEIRRKESAKALEVLAGAADIVGTSAHRDHCWYGEECHRFPRCLGCTLRNLRDRTSPASPADVLEVTGKTSEELIARVRTCGVFVGLQKRGALFGKDYCAVGHEMREPACACCEYLRIAGSLRPPIDGRKLAAGHEAHDLAGGRAGGAGGNSDRDR